MNDYAHDAKNYKNNIIKGTGLLAIRDLPNIANKYIRGNKVLDFGCGAGRFIPFFKSLGFDIQGADISSELLKEAKEKNPDVSFTHLKNDFTLPYESFSFDSVFSIFVLMEINSKDSLERVIGEIYRILKKDGIFVFITNSDFLYDHYDWVSLDVNFPENKQLKSGGRAKCFLKNIGVTLFDYYWTTNDYKEIIKNTSFELLEIISPKGTPEDGVEWKDELRVSPYSIYVLKK